MKEKTPLSHNVVCFQMLDFETSKSKAEVMENYFFLEKYVTSEGAVSHNVLHYYQQLSIACYQERFYVNTYFE